MKKYVIMDLDGTLACGKHRLHLLPQKDHNLTESWIEFNMACVNDAPIKDTIEICNSLQKDYIVIILTGRSDHAGDETKTWLEINRVNYDELVMRKSTDNRKDTVIKEEFLRTLGLDNILCLFDDSPEVIKHMRSLGLTVYQVCDYGDQEGRHDLKSHGADK